MSDILVECDKRRLCSMLTVLERHLPVHIQEYNLIYNYLYHYDRINGNRSSVYSDRWNLRFYTHRNGDIENCTLVTISGSRNYLILGFTLQQSHDELKECLQNTNLINWNNSTLNLMVDERLFRTVNDLACQKVATQWIYPPTENVMHISKEKINQLCLNSHILPDDLYLAPLRPELHSKIIDDHWSYKAENSECLIRQSIQLNGGVGLFRRDVEQPVCWITTNEFFTPGFLYTLKPERGQGYGQLLMKVELKRLLKLHGIDLFSFVSVENAASLALHYKLGFQAVSTVRWIEKPPK